MKEKDLKQRTKRFALDVIGFCESLPKDETSKTLGRQLLRSGTSVGANYRAVCRAKSTADFISKFGTVLEPRLSCAFFRFVSVDIIEMSLSFRSQIVRLSLLRFVNSLSFTHGKIKKPCLHHSKQGLENSYISSVTCLPPGYPNSFRGLALYTTWIGQG